MYKELLFDLLKTNNMKLEFDEIDQEDGFVTFTSYIFLKGEEDDYLIDLTISFNSKNEQTYKELYDLLKIELKK